VQLKFNEEHGITPQTVKKSIRTSIESEVKARRTVAEAVRENVEQLDQTEIVKLLEEEMIDAARNLEFERAAQLRDKINEIKGAPTIKSGSAWGPAEEEGDRQKIWQPKTSTRPGKRRAAK
jgi:excinuclease ABC subunit B